MNIVNLIKQINRARRIHNSLFEQIELGVTSKKQTFNAEGLYKRNEQEYYNLLRTLHELDHFLVEKSAALSLEEQMYFETLLRYGNSLLKAIQFFPKLTYFFWQKSLGKNHNRFYQKAFVGDWNKYQLLQYKTGKMFGRVKGFN